MSFASSKFLMVLTSAKIKPLFCSNLKNILYFCSPFEQSNGKMVVVAQSVRALVCGTRGRGFEPHLPPKKKNPVLKCRVFCCRNPPQDSRAKRCNPDPKIGINFR